MLTRLSIYPVALLVVCKIFSATAAAVQPNVIFILASIAT